MVDRTNNESSGSSAVAAAGKAIRSPLRMAHHNVDGVKLHVVEAGPEAGPAVVLLHGFPEFWYGWRQQFDALAEAGYRVVAPDQRGYNLSDKPRGVAAYDLDILARDIIGLADGLGLGKFAVVGHDWGGLVAWWIAAHYPDRITCFVALAAPHPSAWVDAIRHDSTQRRKSWYVQAFQLPWLPELLLRQNNYKALVDALQATAQPDACTAADIEAYRRAWSMPGSLTAMLNWYRALQAKHLKLAEAPRAHGPGLLLWGNRDKFGIKDLVRRSVALGDETWAAYLDTTHWIQHEAPQRLNDLLLDFLKKNGRP